MRQHRRRYRRKSDKPEPEIASTHSPVQRPPDHPHTILQLQATIGNQAVKRLFGKPRIQREETGLRNAGESKQYAQEARNLWLDEGNHARPMKQVVSEVADAVNARLEANDVPKVQIGFGDLSRQFGSFIPGRWLMMVDPHFADNQPKDAAFKEYEQPSFTKLVETLYHEARHAEQRFLIARWLAGRRLSPTQIADELGIPLDIAKKASRVRLLESSGDPKLLEQAELWYKFAGHNGEYSDVEPLIEELDETVIKIIHLLNNAEEDNFQKFVPQVNKIVKGLSGSFESQLKKLQKRAQKASPKSEADETVVQILDLVESQLQKIRDDWADTQSNMDYIPLMTFAMHLDDLRADIKQADDLVPTEMDALETGWFVALEVAMLRLR